MLWAGKARPDIMQFFAKTYSAKVRTVDGYIKDARKINEKRKEAADALRAEKDKEEIEAIAKELGISRKTILAELRKVAFMDVRKLYNEDGTIKKFSDLDDETAGAIAGVEVLEEIAGGEWIGTNRKVRSNSKLTAIETICKLLGYAPQPGAKVKIEEGEGEEKKTVSVTLNLG